jgi:hypothetical protein
VADVELSMSDADVPGTGGSGDSAADNAEALTTAVQATRRESRVSTTDEIMDKHGA